MNNINIFLFDMGKQQKARAHFGSAQLRRRCTRKRARNARSGGNYIWFLLQSFVTLVGCITKIAGFEFREDIARELVYSVVTFEC